MGEEAVAATLADQAQHGDGLELGHQSAVGDVGVAVHAPLRRGEVDGSTELDIGGIGGLNRYGSAVVADAHAKGRYDVRSGAG